MAKAISDEIQQGVKELIEKITHYEENSPEFNVKQKWIITTLKKSDTMYFLNTKDIKKAILNMSEKFQFHSFFKHAEHLKKAHDKYIDKNLSESDLTPRLNMVKFLLCMSDSPTNHFWQNPDQFEFIQEETEEEVVDWTAYLNEGIERWSPVKDESSESGDEVDYQEGPHEIKSPRKITIKECHQVETYDFRASRTKLLDSVQHGWFGGEKVCMKPPSEWFDANVGILWEQHLQSQVKGLMQLDPVTVISEYKVMREVIWQLWEPHNSTVFQLYINRLLPRNNVTIASVCSTTFEKFMASFTTYCEILDQFQQFYTDLEKECVCETYKSYGNALQKMSQPFFDQLIEIENEIREQENSMTLLKLANKLERIFEPIRVLKSIHDEIIVDFRQNSSLFCALSLLTRLRKSLHFCVNKIEQDTRLTLYLESLYHYFNLINGWLVKNDLCDHSQEFIIVKNGKDVETPQMNFFPQDDMADFVDDGIIQLISDQVLQIGRNLHLLRLLGKYLFVKGSETIHEEFVRRILEELSSYYGVESPEKNSGEITFQKIETSFDLNQMGDWTNFVDSSDGFLMKAFESFYWEKTENSDEQKCLFEKISGITLNLFPLQSLPEKIFSQILRERFTVSGLMVKNLLIENYFLDKQFEFLNHIFLFSDDLIFPFYRRLFEKMNIGNSNWGNSVWLTSHLQDLIMDLYPQFFEDSSVQVKNYWKQCQDSLEALTLIKLEYEIKWPLSIIITKEHLDFYRELFGFILKLKWALYTINHLSFADVEPKITGRPCVRPSSKKLKYLRFNLINILNTIQHYFFGYIFTKHKIRFELDFEKSNDLKSLIAAHDNFITSIYRSMCEIRDPTNGFDTLLRCVKMLKVMWNRQEHTTPTHLEACHEAYKSSFKIINFIVNPVYFNS